MEYYSIELHMVKVYRILAKWTDANISESLVKEKSVKFNVDFGLQLWHTVYFYSYSKINVNKLEVSGVSWVHQETAVTGQTATLKSEKIGE